jgi:hypothetical protein
MPRRLRTPTNPQPPYSLLHSPFSILHSPLSILPLCICLALLAACAPATPPPTPTPVLTPTPTPTPPPTPTPSPTPTATPIPPLALTIHWPAHVSALRPVPVEVELVPPPGVSVTAALYATVIGPQGLPYWLFDLSRQEGYLYVADRMVQFPLEPPEGDWRLIVHVRSTLDVVGERVVVFQPDPIVFRDLAGDLPAGVSLRVPQEFMEALARGDLWAGGRAWRYADGELALWWAPGPVEPLLLNNAVVILEATHDPDAPPRVLDVEETQWQGQTAFLFHEEWPGDRPGAEGGPAEALVVQGPGYWLYVLRVRTLGGEAIPPLFRQVRETFAFVEE